MAGQVVAAGRDDSAQVAANQVDSLDIGHVAQMVDFVPAVVL